MADLIERSAALKEIMQEYPDAPFVAWYASLIRGIPAVDAVEVRHGHWTIRKFGDRAKCSVCGMTFADAYDLEDYDNYCRHCGAVMENIKLVNTKQW